MSLETDLLIDRRRLRRRLALWRAGAILVAALALFAGLSRAGAFDGLRGHVARLAITGVISDDRRTVEAIDRAARDRSVRALIVAVDSPGGTVAGGEALYRAIARFAARKPAVAVMRGTAASAGYMVALPTARIFARESTVTGSIGVILQSVDASALLARLGVRGEAITSGPLKDQPSPFHPLSEAGRAALNDVIGDLYAQFVAMVVAGRHLPEARVRELADGRIFSGRQALGLGLVDAIGDEREARAWLASERGIPAATRVRDLAVRGPAERWLAAATNSLAQGVVFRLLGPGATGWSW